MVIVEAAAGDRTQESAGRNSISNDLQSKKLRVLGSTN